MDWINVIIYSFIAVAVVGTAWSLVYVCSLYFGLSKALKNSAEELKNVLDSTNIENLVKQCDRIFSKYPNLERTWESYKRRLNNSQTYALIHSREFFSREKLIGMNIQFMDIIKAVPGLLTAWGLLGTFIAILMGLSGIDPNNIETVSHLVNGLSAKFWSSIFALICSIIFVFIERAMYSIVKNSCINFQYAMEDVFPTMSTNEILHNMENNMGIQVNTMNTLSKKLAQNSLESIEKMVDMFRKTLSDGATEQFRDIADTISELNSLMAEIQETQDLYLDRMDAVNTNSKILVEQHEQMLNSLFETVEQVNKKVEIFKYAIDSSKDAQEELSRIAGEIAYAGEQFATVTPSLDKNNALIKDLTDNLNRSVSYFNDVTNEMSSGKLNETISQFKEGVKSSLTDIQVGLNEDLQIIKEGYKWHDTQLNKLIDTATTNIDKIHSSMNDYSEKTSAFLSQYDESIAHAMNYLNNNIHTMDNSLKNNLRNLENNFSDLNKTLKNINEKVGNGVE